MKRQMINLAGWAGLVILGLSIWGWVNKPSFYSGFSLDISTAYFSSGGSAQWNTTHFGYEIAGFGIGSGSVSYRITLPFYFLVTVSAHVFGAVLVKRVRERMWRDRLVRAKADGTCARCGYDLRATPRRCPECGWVVPY